MAKVKKIEYDISDITKAKNAVNDLIDNLNNDCTALDSALAQLKKDWNTDAGKKFFKDHKDTWTEYVKLYVKKLTGIKNMLEKAETAYTNINDEVSKLKI